MVALEVLAFLGSDSYSSISLVISVFVMDLRSLAIQPFLNLLRPNNILNTKMMNTAHSRQDVNP